MSLRDNLRASPATLPQSTATLPRENMMTPYRRHCVAIQARALKVVSHCSPAFVARRMTS